MARISAFTIALLLIAGPALGQEITGKGLAIDGDSLMIGEVTIDLFGIDAPELAQTCTTKKGKQQECGSLARQVLDSLIKNVKIKCKTEGTQPDGVQLATCYAGPFNINEQMIAAGWAFVRIDQVPAYARAEKFAKARVDGIWRGTFISPAQWRSENPAQ
jgi:endonuclease YncB( thermonuclease family)